MSRSGRDSSDRTLEFYFALSVSIGILRSAAFSLTIRICFSPSIRLIRRVSSRHASAKYAVARLHDPRATEFRQKVTSADANDRRGKTDDVECRRPWKGACLARQRLSCKWKYGLHVALRVADGRV